QRPLHSFPTRRSSDLGVPVFMKSAKGAYLTDEDDRTYIDYINSWGPAIVGHTHPVVLEAIQKQAEKGFSFGTPTELETEVARFRSEEHTSELQSRENL